MIIVNEIPAKVSLLARSKVVLAGGTIASKKTDKGYRTSGSSLDFINEITKRLPDCAGPILAEPPEIAYEGLSENLNESSLSQIVEATRRALQNNPKAVVILTGANLDLSHPKTDALDNLNYAFKCAQGFNKAVFITCGTDTMEQVAKKVQGLGVNVYVAFHGRFIPAELVVKEPFNGTEMNYAAKNDPEYLNSLLLSQQHSDEVIARLQDTLIKQKALQIEILEYPVNVIRSNHSEFLEYVKSRNIKVVLLILYHSGTANTEGNETSVAKLVKDLREEKDIIFFGVTENGEPTDLHSYETGIKLLEAGVVPLYDMTRAVALVKLKLVASETNARIIDAMLTPVAGEIDTNRIHPEDIEQLKKLYSG